MSREMIGQKRKESEEEISSRSRQTNRQETSLNKTESEEETSQKNCQKVLAKEIRQTSQICLTSHEEICDANLSQIRRNSVAKSAVLRQEQKL
jgi:hypothetical protein